MAEAKRCTRCYRREDETSFTDGYKQCDDCRWLRRQAGQVRASQWMANHHEEMMAIKPEGDPCVYVCEKRGLDLAIIREMVDAHKEVCDWMKYEKGAVKVTTPEEIVVRHLGDPDKAENREEHNKVIVTYLSASIDAATWMGYFEPYSRRATWRK